MGFVVEGLNTQFPDSFEKMAIDYIFSKWSLTGDLLKGSALQDKTKKIRFKVGFPDYHKPYEVNAIKIRTDAKPMDPGQTRYDCYTYVDIALRMKRLARDTYVNQELKQMEDEFSRICGSYVKEPVQEITGVRNLIWGGDERVYGGTDNYATSNWRSIGHMAFWYGMLQTY